jgi:hypothetical protein
MRLVASDVFKVVDSLTFVKIKRGKSVAGELST